MNSTPAIARQHSTARATFSEPPVTSSAKEAMASKPRYESTATDTAPSTAPVGKPSEPSPVNGDSQPRCAPPWTSTDTAATTNTSSTAISRASTANPTRAAARTPHRFSRVVTITASAVHTHRDTSGTSAFIAIPENR